MNFPYYHNFFINLKLFEKMFRFNFLKAEYADIELLCRYFQHILPVITNQ